ncbi:hypothetical protein N8I77_011426 [Diaporthe amygdali]|uniref:Uncharacterized protein n=1 Tax=Phomopsis amygdali TaxID=1214568 RepID=A0AAD9S8A7_PHOAM|nr:hypothetical protein N8I77_011426 [Diaporthe amygdali]
MKFFILFTIITFSLAVRGGLQLDYADVPAPCVDTCRPVAEISGICDVDADFDDNNEEVEDLMKLQCMCANQSFDVGGATALCASCIDQKALPSDKADNMDDINEIMARCGFKSLIWTPDAAKTAPAVANVSVSASRLTASSQITTTIDFAPRPTSTQSQSGHQQKSNKHKNKHG